MKERYAVVVGGAAIQDEAVIRVKALEDAARRGSGVRVVSAFVPPEYWAVSYGLTALPTLEDLVQDCAQIGQAAVDAAVAADPEFGAVPTEVVTPPGPAAKALLEQAADADLLVVGHRGRGGFTSAVLGSVGLHCVLHATCPVTVVRPQRVAAPAPRVEEADEAGAVFVPIY